MLEKLKKHKIALIIILLLIVIISIITANVLTKDTLLIDDIAYNIFVENLRNEPLTRLMKLITSLSNTGIIAVITVTVALLIKDKKIAFSVPLNLALVALLNQILKDIFQRPRPNGFRLIEIGGYSFPSGHAMASMALYGFLAYLSYKLVINKKLKIFLIILNFTIIFLIGISRIYLGVHYLSDVLVGYSVSIIYLIVYTRILRKLEIVK